MLKIHDMKKLQELGFSIDTDNDCYSASGTSVMVDKTGELKLGAITEEAQLKATALLLWDMIPNVDIVN